MWELGPGKSFNFENVVQEFNQFVGVLANVGHIIGLLHGVVVTTNLFDAASGRPDDTVIVLKVLNEEAFRRLRIGLVAAVGHRLSAASLIERVVDIETELF